jgi:rare lipoprotein A
MKKLFLLILSVWSLQVGAQTLTGIASFYNNKFNGRRTATGAVFSNSGLTCACNKLPLGTRVRVTNLKNGKSIEVVVNDRLAANNHRVVDLTERAAKELGFYSAGLTKVKVEVIQKKNEKKGKKVETTIDQESPLIIIDSASQVPILDSVKH